jgi:hypothetical protein
MKMRYICEMCGEPFEIDTNYEPKKIKKKSVCEDCYYNFVGDSIESGSIGVFPPRGRYR